MSWTMTTVACRYMRHMTALVSHRLIDSDELSSTSMIMD